MIDKEIRLQARQQRQALQKDLNSNPGASSQLAQKKPKTCSYSNWVKRKKFEERYKYALMMRALKNKHEKELLEQQEKAHQENLEQREIEKAFIQQKRQELEQVQKALLRQSDVGLMK